MTVKFFENRIRRFVIALRILGEDFAQLTARYEQTGAPEGRNGSIEPSSARCSGLLTNC